ncbi:MAG: alpha/beta hydrolase [Ruminococcaceae bacterium]|nr:alpha/beta hydrolase [Oscillospiraceae bacterium]
MRDYLSVPHVDDPLDVSDIPRQRRGLQYLAPDGSARAFDLYYPDTGSGPFPVILSVAGGAWYYGCPSSVHLGRTIHNSVRRGYAFASIACTSSRYRKFPYQIAEVKCALRHLRREAEALDLDTDFVGCWSASSGAHLSLLAALTEHDAYFDTENDGISCRIDALAAVYPCFRLDVSEADFRAIGLEADNLRSGPRCMDSIFLGAPVEDSPELCRLAAPITHVHSGAPPMLLLHGTADTTVPYTFTLEFARALRNAVGAENVYTRFLPGAVHSDPRFKDDAMSTEVLDFFDRVRLGQLPCPPECQNRDLP